MRKISLVLVTFGLLAATVARAQEWQSLGPSGGDVRALAVDPSHPARVFLGTADGHIFGSEDAAAHWRLLGRVSSRLDAVITAIVVDPRNENVLFASAWAQDSGAGGGIFCSADGGRTWVAAGLAGQSVRALAMAPSNPDFLVAGTLDGVYRSQDFSRSWERISPEHHAELRNLDSLAIDPRDPQTIYAGTFHLPWKTTDGGRTWNPIHSGMIDDSDVMSLLIDGTDPRRVFASACSGIYRSDDAAGGWRKIQGIPYTARRTYAIAQNPQRPGAVYAATSEGLWQTSDGGMTWRRTTPETWVINTVVVAGNPERILIGTEALGVLVSDDEGGHFESANVGFDHRQILALGLDAARPARILAVLAHAPEPVLATEDDGRTWAALGPGLRAEQVLGAFTAPDGVWWVSLARGGLERYNDERQAWEPAGTVVEGAPGAKKASRFPATAPRAVGARDAARPMRGSHPLSDVVTDMAFSPKVWYAATTSGLLASINGGATWRLKPIGPLASLPVQSVRVSSNGQRIWAVSLRGLVFSEDGGGSWTWHDLPLNSGGAIALRVAPGDENTLIATAHTGLYISRDAGKTWQQAASGLPATPVQDFAATGGVFVASMRTGGLYVSDDAGRTWDRVPGVLADGFFSAVAPFNDAGVIFVASTTEGLLKVKWPRPAPGSH